MDHLLSPATKYFDHTLLKPDVTERDLKAFCGDCIDYGFAMAAVNPASVPICRRYLQGTDVHVGAAVGFPLGQNTIETKQFEAQDAIRKGADEIDYVINITQLKERNYVYIAEEMHAVVDLCREHGRISKVIFETCCLTDSEKRELCRVVREVRPDYVKTSTGFGNGGATVEDIALMLDCVRD